MTFSDQLSFPDMPIADLLPPPEGENGLTFYTIGHSTRSTDELVACLRGHGVQTLVDIRSYPGSRRCPWFSQGVLEQSMDEAGLDYLRIGKLGGRRNKQREVPAHLNAAWRNASFRNYADYTMTSSYEEGLKELCDLAATTQVAYMCSEAVPWRCHRSLVSNTLRARGHQVLHIQSPTRATRHELGMYGPTPHVSGVVVTYPGGVM